jgi:hypothetical protein
MHQNWSIQTLQQVVRYEGWIEWHAIWYGTDIDALPGCVLRGLHAISSGSINMI